ncbi:hypothetical protein LJC49_09035 [Ruminococcaceae bacterium OttesenSCG-928-I18]|nr:hypothetical protein [Ruminococcaceae bacterium OttesenSCG-928-I18]
MKKALILFLSLVVCVALFTACGGGEASSAKPASQASASTPAPAPSEAVTEAPAAEEAAEAPAAEGEEEYYSQDFTILNSTGVDIYELYISPTGVDEWGEDALGEDVLANGESATVVFDVVATDGITWDIATVDADGDEAVFPSVDLSSISNIELAYQDGTTPVANVS